MRWVQSVLFASEPQQFVLAPQPSKLTRLVSFQDPPCPAHFEEVEDEGCRGGGWRGSEDKIDDGE